MGTLIFWGGIVLGGFLGIMLFSLSSLAQKAEEVYDRMSCGEEIGLRGKPYGLLLPETLSPTSRGEARPQGNLSESVTAP
jgi:hypothetical protein